MKRMLLLLAVVALLLGGVGQARAGTITLYNNLSATSGGADFVAANPPSNPNNVAQGPLADSFSTGASAVNLSDVKLLLGLFPNGTTTGSITVTLNSDSSTSPGAVLTTIGTINDSSLSSTLGVVDLATSFSLAANTRYWIELSTSNNSSAQWSWSNDTSGVGVANEFFFNEHGAAPNSNGPYQMEVTAQTATTGVPEPSTLTLLGIGSLSLLGYGWRRRKQVAA
jgi:hypothetical protein